MRYRGITKLWFLALAIPPSPAAAQSSTNLQAALDHYRTLTSVTAPDPCARTTASDDVVVCAQKVDFRLATIESAPAPRRRTGNPRTSLDNTSTPCTVHGCYQGMNVVGIASALGRLIRGDN